MYQIRYMKLNFIVFNNIWWKLCFLLPADLNDFKQNFSQLILAVLAKADKSFIFLIAP